MLRNIIKKISFPVELLLLLFVLLNVVKLTGVQWFITQSVYRHQWVILKNVLFLYTFWRMVFLLKNRTVFIGVYIVQTLYLAIHTAYYLYSGQTLLLPQFIFSFFEGLRAVSSLYIVLDSPWFYLLFIDTVVFIVVYRSYNSIRVKILSPSVLIIPLMLLLTSAGFLRLGYLSTEVMKFDSFNRRNYKFGTIYAQAYDLTIDQNQIIKEIEYGEIKHIEGRDKLFNIVTIQVESLNADLIGYKYNDLEVLPFLNNASNKHIYYPYMLAQHKTGNSSDAEFSVFNSIEALSGYPAAQFTEYEYPNSFVKQLINHDKLAFHGNQGDYYNRYYNMEKMGFDYFWDRIRMNLEQKGWGAPDENVYDFMLDQISKTDRPFYYHHITMSSHGPFDNVSHYFEHPVFKNIKDKRERDFLTTFAYVDRTIEEFITHVQKIRPDTYFFIYGDHTVQIEGQSYKSGSRTKIDDILFEYVPLIIITPDEQSYIEETRVVSFLDLAPTILYASGQKSEINTFGELLIPKNKNTLQLNNKVKFFDNFYPRENLFSIINSNGDL